jgi:hypothetical protein
MKRGRHARQRGVAHARQKVRQHAENKQASAIGARTNSGQREHVASGLTLSISLLVLPFLRHQIRCDEFLELENAPDSSESSFDSESLDVSGQAIRDEDGKCVRCGGVQVGLVAGSINEHVRGAKHQLRLQMEQAQWSAARLVDRPGDGGSGVAVTLLQLEGAGQAGVGERFVGGAHKLPLQAVAGQQVTLQLRSECHRKAPLKQILCVPPLSAALGTNLVAQTLPYKPHKKRGRNFSETINFVFHPSAGAMGVHRTLLGLAFAGPVLRLLTLEVQVVACSTMADALASLAPTEPYQQPAHKRSVVAGGIREQDMLSGEPPAANSKTDWQRPLEHEHHPPGLQFKKPAEIDAAFAALEGKLSSANYAAWFRLLLHLESLQAAVDINMFDQHSEFNHSRGGGLFGLEVPGLAEARPSVLIGDSILASAVDFETAAAGRRKIYKGFVHQVDQRVVWLKFHASFGASYITGQKMHVRFQLNPVPAWRCHQALKLMAVFTTRRDLDHRDGHCLGGERVGAAACVGRRRALRGPGHGEPPVTRIWPPKRVGANSDRHGAQRASLPRV